MTIALICIGYYVFGLLIFGFIGPRLKYQVSLGEWLIMGGLLWPLSISIILFSSSLETLDDKLNIDITDRLKKVFGGPKS